MNRRLPPFLPDIRVARGAVAVCLAILLTACGGSIGDASPGASDNSGNNSGNNGNNGGSPAVCTTTHCAPAP